MPLKEPSASAGHTSWAWRAVFPLVSAVAGYALGDAGGGAERQGHVEAAVVLEGRTKALQVKAHAADARVIVLNHELTRERAQRENLARSYQKAETARRALVLSRQEQDRRHACVLRHISHETRVAMAGFRGSLAPRSVAGILRQAAGKAVAWIPVVGDAAALGANYYESRVVAEKLDEAEARISSAARQAAGPCQSGARRSGSA